MSSDELPPRGYGEDYTEKDETIHPKLIPRLKIGFNANQPRSAEVEEIQELLHEHGIRYSFIPMTDMWRGSPTLYRVESNENGKDVSVEIAAGVDDTIRRLRSSEFCETLLEKDKYEEGRDE